MKCRHAEREILRKDLYLLLGARRRWRIIVRHFRSCRSVSHLLRDLRLLSRKRHCLHYDFLFEVIINSTW